MRPPLSLTLAALICLTGCVPTARHDPPRFAASTSLDGDRVVVRVTNLGPATLWLDPNHCPRSFEVGTTERLPTRLEWVAGQAAAPIEVCVLIKLPPELWRVGETRSGTLAGVRLPQGTHTVTAWAEPRFGADRGGQPQGAWRTQRVQAPTAVLSVP